MKLSEIISAPINHNVNLRHEDVKFGKIIQKFDKTDHSFRCENLNLTTLENCPSHIGGLFAASVNKLTSLEFAPTYVGKNCVLFANKITSLNGISKRFLREVHGNLAVQENPIISNVLGVILIKGLRGLFLENKPVEDILIRHLYKDQDVLECREELVQAGYKEYAKL